MRRFLPGILIEFVGIVILTGGIVTNSLLGMMGGICLILSAIGIHIFQIRKSRRASQTTIATDKSKSLMQQEFSEDSTIAYSDSLVTITENAIIFKNYSLLSKPRRINFTDIDHIDVWEPSVATGKWRIWGSGNFATWYPLDGNRPSRNKIFHVYLKIRGMDVGFTVENSGEVTAILRSKGLIGSEVGEK